MLSERDIYKAVSDTISDAYEWLMDDTNSGRIEYILGANDVARELIGVLRKGENICKADGKSSSAPGAEVK